jgi:transposase
MMDQSRTTTCSGCEELKREIRALKAQLAQLADQLAKAQKNSSNSSKPPSSDITKPPRPAPAQGKRKQGGQPGHPQHQREPFAPDEVDEKIDYRLEQCPCCGGPVALTVEPPRIHPQVELAEKPIVVSEHRAPAYWCSRCQKIQYAPIDPAVRRAGLVGPALTSLVAFLKGGCHCSFTTIRKFLRDVLKLPLSRGQLVKLCSRVTASVESAYQELLKLLPKQTILNVDETGHKDRGENLWTWCFRAPWFTLFKISPSRGSQVLAEVLGDEFNGILGCDYYSAYRKYMGDSNVLVQFCLAHLIRDLKFLTTHPDRRNQAYGRRVLKAARDLFALIHRREEMDEQRFRRELEDAGNELWGAAIYRVPKTAEAENLAQRFEKHGDSYIRFITTPGVEPTNNLAEQAIRFVVIDRMVTQGSRGQVGQNWLSRIWTMIATCAQQGRSVFTFLKDSLLAYLKATPAPSLAPDTS